ncbi:MAG: hypothetical protein J6J05_05205, partial [Peptococcaceae bacterium]|nr:hypothetical protein [Peptococcaceae bacterium]
EMGGTMETKIIAYIILFVILFFGGATTVIYYGSRINEWRGIFKNAMAEVEAEQVDTAQDETPKTKEPIGFVWVKRHLTVPFIFLIAFIVEYAVTSLLMGSERVEMLFILVFAMLAMVVLETLAIDKKAPRVRFWMHLGVAILFEICVVIDVYLFLSGYYFGDGLRLKRIAGAIAGIFLFFAEAYRTQQSWKAMLAEKDNTESITNDQCNKE